MRDKLKIYCLGTPIVDTEERFDMALLRNSVELNPEPTI